MEQSMNYLRSNLLVDILGSTGGFDYFSTDADAVVYQIRQRDEVAVTSFRDRFIKSIEDRSKCTPTPEIHLRLTISSFEQLRILLERVLHPVVSCVWVSDISNAQQVRDLDVEIRRIEMRSGWIPGRIRLIPEFDSGHPVQILEEILGSADRISGICVDLERIYRDITFRDTSDSFDSVLIAGVVSRLVIAASYLNLRLIAVDSLTSNESSFPEFAAENGFSGVLTARSSEIAYINQSLSPSASQLEAADSLVSEWEKHDGQEIGLQTNIERLVRAKYLLEQSEN
jgi:citrate lyase beta subunit